MLRPIPSCFSMLLIVLISCQSSYQRLTVHALLNYDNNSSHRILFMDFTVNRSGPGKREYLTLTNSIVGNGEMKNIGKAVHSPYQLKFVRQYADQHPPVADSIEHPLLRSIEIADIDGSLTRKLTSELTGNFSIRFPYTTALKKIDFYSVTPDKGAIKIHTIQIKP